MSPRFAFLLLASATVACATEDQSAYAFLPNGDASLPSGGGGGAAGGGLGGLGSSMGGTTNLGGTGPGGGLGAGGFAAGGGLSSAGGGFGTAGGGGNAGGFGAGGFATGTGGKAAADAGPIPPDDRDCEKAYFGGHRYWFCSNNETWDGARSKCQAIGGDLVIVNSAEEQTFLEGPAGNGVWLIGLDKKNASTKSAADKWEWVDGSDPAAGYSNWDSGKPDNNDCGGMNDGAWEDRACGLHDNWICEVVP